MVTRICNQCGEPGPWIRCLSADVFQDVRGIDPNGDLHVETSDTRIREGRSFKCTNCGRKYPAGMWWNGLDDVET